MTEPGVAGGAFAPTRLIEVELENPLPGVPSLGPSPGRTYRHGQALVRVHSRPIGLVPLDLGETGLEPEALASAIWGSLAWEIAAHLAADDLPTPARLTAEGIRVEGEPRCRLERRDRLARAPFVSVIVSTRDHPDLLARCLDSLLRLDYPTYEVIVVDNAPRTSGTADLLRQRYSDSGRVRYVREDRPGLSRARNCGVASSRASIVAFTDDDAVVDREWLAELVAGFSLGERVGCVTGLTMPLELETPAQSWFEQYGGFGKGFSRRVYDLGANRPDNPLFPFTAGRLGSGVNMAFKVEALEQVGLFDPALGAGTPAGGEDLAAFFQVVTRGYTLVYEPAALLYHQHRRTYRELHRQIYESGAGQMTFLAKCLLDDPRQLLPLLRRLPAVLMYALDPRSPKNVKRQASYPPALVTAERLGMIHGLPRYFWSKLRIVLPRRSSTATARSTVKRL